MFIYLVPTLLIVPNLLTKQRKCQLILSVSQNESFALKYHTIKNFSNFKNNLAFNMCVYVTKFLLQKFKLHVTFQSIFRKQDSYFGPCGKNGAIIFVTKDLNFLLWFQLSEKIYKQLDYSTKFLRFTIPFPLLAHPLYLVRIHIYSMF